MGQTTVRKGRGNSTVSKSIFCVGFFSTYTITLGIHTYIFHNRECDFFKYFFGGGQPSDGGGGACPLRPPRDLRPWYTHNSLKYGSDNRICRNYTQCVRNRTEQLVVNYSFERASVCSHVRCKKITHNSERSLNLAQG